MKNWFELTYALRMLRKTPGHSSLATIVIALSLSIPLIAFSMINGLFFTPLGFNDSDRWAYFTHIQLPNGSPASSDSVDTFRYQTILDNNTVFDQLGAFKAYSQARLLVNGSTTRVFASSITPNIFEASGVRALIGRPLQASDTNRSEEVAVISFSLWQNQFNGDDNIIGQTTQINGKPTSIVGVMPEGTVFGMEYDLWIAKTWTAFEPNNTNERITPLGILKSNVSLSQAQSELSKLSKNLQNEYPEFYRPGTDLYLFPFQYYSMESSVEFFSAIGIAAALIALLGCINIANLFISRTIERESEFAIRTCVGSSSFRVLRQSLTESALLCIFGAIVAIPFIVTAMKGFNFFIRTIFESDGANVLSRMLLVFNFDTFIAALLILGAIWFICGSFPAKRIANMRFSSSLLNNSKGSTQQNSFKTTKYLVGFQTILSCFLLVVSGSLLISSLRLVNLDYGIKTENRTVINVELPNTVTNPEQRLNLIQAIERDLIALPTITDASAVFGLPHATRLTPFNVADKNLDSQGSYPNVHVSMYSGRAFELNGIKILDGRPFSELDYTGDDQVVIVDRAFAELMWPNQSALGKQVKINPNNSSNLFTVIGVSSIVVPGLQAGGFNRDSSLYLPISRATRNNLQLVVKTQTPARPIDVLTQVKNVTAFIDPQIAVYRPKTMAAYLQSNSLGHQLIGDVFIVLGVVSVVLAVIGVFSVTSRSVLQQVKQIGIRRAIGSSNGKVLALYFKQGLIYLLLATVFGGGLAILISSTLASIYNDILQVIPVVIAATILGLGVFIAAATLLPAYKALKLEPGDALHQV